MLMLRSDDGKKYYFTGIGTGGTKKIQADRKTWTALPVVCGGRMAGVMMIMESSTAGKKAKKATATRPAQRAVMKGETFSTRAINALKKYPLNLTPGKVEVICDHEKKPVTVVALICSHNG